MQPYHFARPGPGPAAGSAAPPPSAPPGPWCAHARCRERALGRRALLGAAAGATAALGAAPWLGPAALAAPPTPQDPKPIPGGLDLGGGLPFIHVMAPGVAGFPIDDEPSSITDFNGFTAYAIIDGAGVGTDTATGATKRYTTNVDMRVMDGAYVGADGQRRHGTFGFVWLDIFDGPVGSNQLHDYNPGILPSGLFWTQAIPPQSVRHDVGRATATWTMANTPMPDFFTFVGSITGGPSVPATVSFEVRWSGVKARHKFDNRRLDFAGQFVVGEATIAWSARQAGFTFQSDPAATSTTVYAELGHERNGVFYRFPERT